jgi:hypothetical protein
MAFLAIRLIFQDSFLAYRDAGTHRQRDEVYPLGGQVFGEVARADVEAAAPHFIDALDGQQAYLAVSSGIGVGIAHNSVALLEEAIGHEFLSGALAFTLADCNYFGHFSLSFTGPERGDDDLEGVFISIRRLFSHLDHLVIGAHQPPFHH